MVVEISYFTISVTSKKIGVKPHVLRFWEKKFLFLKPKKGISGRRYYSPNDIEMLILIKNLLYNEGFTIKGAINYMNIKLRKNSIKDNVLDYDSFNADLDYTISLIKEGNNILKKI